MWKSSVHCVSLPSHTKVHSDNPISALFSHPTPGWGFCGWFCFWTPLYRRAWTWHRDRCCLKQKEQKSSQSYKIKTTKRRVNRWDVTLPPLSRTARLCPLFSSISSLYIPELWMDLSVVTPEAHGAPIPCQEKRVHSLQSALLGITRSRPPKLKLTAIFKRNKKLLRAVFEAQPSLPQLKLHRRYPHWLKCLIQLTNFSQGWLLTGNYMRVASSRPTRVLSS